MTRRFLPGSLPAVAVWLLLPFAAISTAAHAAFPDRPIRLVVPYAPGGGVDTVMRLIGPRMSAVLGQPVVIENKAGAATILATEAVAKAQADGYTLLATGAPIYLNSALGKTLPYDPLVDLAPVSLVVILPGIIAVNPKAPPRSLRELVEWSKTVPGGVNFASAGGGSIGHLGGEFLASRSGAKLAHVGYKGSSPALVDVMSGQVPVLVDALVPTGAQASAGKVRALAVASKQRVPSLPDVPTLTEAGYPDADFGGTFGLMLPAGTPPDIVARLNAAVKAALADTETRRKLVELGYEIVGDSPAEYGQFIRSQLARWSKVVKDNDIKSD